MQMNRLSVVLTVYNQSAHIGRAIEAIVGQSRLPDEFIILDDCSTDSSSEIIMSYAGKYPFIKFVKNDMSIGAISSMQNACAMATGDYIYIAGAVEWVLPGYFEKAMNMFEKYPQAGLSCANPCCYNPQTKETNETELMWAEKAAYLSPDQIAEIIAGTAVCTHTAIVKRDAFYEAGGIIPELKVHPDWFFCQVTAFRYGIIYFPEAVLVDNAVKCEGDGAGEWSGHKEFVASVLRLLKSPRFQDVLPYFIRGGVMNHFSYDAIRVVMGTPEFWDTESLLLIQQPLYTWNNRLVQIRNERSRIALEKRVAALLKKCEELISTDKITESELIVNDLIRDFPNVPDVYFLKSKIEMIKGNMQSALDASKKMASIGPRNAKAKVLEGFINYQIKDYINARKAFTDALALEPSNIDALINLAEMSMIFKQGDAAIEYCHIAASYHPQNAEVFNIEGDLLMEMQRGTEAKVCYEKALSIDPSNDSVRQKLLRING